MIYALIGISGVGKSYLTNYALENCQNDLKKLIAVTTREKRKNEIDGVDKYFLSEEQFRKIKNNLILVRSMYGAYYGFKRNDITVGKNLIVELYYKDYLKLRKEGYAIKGIYVQSQNKQYRRNIVKNRYSKKIMYVRREIADIYNNIVHRFLLKKGCFEYVIYNDYGQSGEEKMLFILKGK